MQAFYACLARRRPLPPRESLLTGPRTRIRRRCGVSFLPPRVAPIRNARNGRSGVRRAPIRRLAVFAGGWVAVAAGNALADDDATRRQPMPEPLLAETITDIDGRAAGELEVELNALSWPCL